MNYPRAYWLLLLALVPSFIHGGQIAPRVEVLDRFVGIDFACAWPQITLLRTGEIAALIWPYPNHGFNEGAVECWASRDGGRSWVRRSTPVPNEPGVARLNVAGGLTPSGDYIAIVGGFGDKPSVANAATYILPSVVPNPVAPVSSISSDEGHTWSTSQAQFTEPSGRNMIPYGRVGPLDRDEIGVMCYFRELVFFTSRDGGITWSPRGLVSSETHNETTWVQLANDELYAVARTAGRTGVDAFRSSDRGRTWVKEGSLTLPRQYPADLIKITDGRLLLTYSSRNQGSWAIWARFGDETASVWSDPVRIADLEDATDHQEGVIAQDGGYPSTVYLPDGSFVTAYYNKGIPAHRRYHMAVTRWRLGEPTVAK